MYVYACVSVAPTVCVCLTALVKLLKLINSRLAPKEQQMFSGDEQYFKVLGRFVVTAKFTASWSSQDNE